MSSKKIAGWTIGALVVVAIVAVAITAATTGAEAGKVDGMLRDAVNSKKPIGPIVGQLKDLGYDLAPNSTGPVSGKGPGHWAIIYGTWLTVTIDTREDQTVSGYHLDRASTWF